MRENPLCIYCGGLTSATTVDHVPPRALFEARQRPKGLEFAACDPCNSGGSKDELVASLLARTYPDPISEQARLELCRLIQGADNNNPGLLLEMMPSIDQESQLREIQGSIAELPKIGGVLNCKGPLLNKAIHRFGAKIGFALHYELTKKIIPPDGGVSVWWYTNHQAVLGQIPHHLLGILGEPKTLRQGKQEVGRQFRYGSVGTREGTMSAHLASFNMSFSVCAFVSDNATKIRPPADIEYVTTHRPGWLQSTS